MPSQEPNQAIHLSHLCYALESAKQSPPKPTNFRVGCIIVSYSRDAPPEGTQISFGYTLEREGNTHAEQNALAKLAENNIELTAEMHVYLYTTLEPCGLRLSGQMPCVKRIIQTREGNPDGGIRKVVFGAREPGTFVKDSQSLRMLDEAGIEWEWVKGLEEDILGVAMEGHQQKEAETEGKAINGDEGHQQQPANPIDDITPEERQRQEKQPRNPKKRMMEVDVPT
jgi:pyrimidine deaminase RibD-like protein